jgi:hypothetical protein
MASCSHQWQAVLPLEIPSQGNPSLNRLRIDIYSDPVDMSESAPLPWYVASNRIRALSKGMVSVSEISCHKYSWNILMGTLRCELGGDSANWSLNQKYCPVFELPSEILSWKQMSILTIRKDCTHGWKRRRKFLHNKTSKTSSSPSKTYYRR